MLAADDTADCERMQKLALVPAALVWVRSLKIELIVLLDSVLFLDVPCRKAAPPVISCSPLLAMARSPTRHDSNSPCTDNSITKRVTCAIARGCFFGTWIDRHFEFVVFLRLALVNVKSSYILQT